MGRRVELWKESESNDVVTYRYGPSLSESGVMTINKDTGELIGEEVPGLDRDKSWFVYGMLAKAKAEKMYKAKEYPEHAMQVT